MWNLTSWYCKAIKGRARPVFLQNQNWNGIYKVYSGNTTDPELALKAVNSGTSPINFL